MHSIINDDSHKVFTDKHLENLSKVLENRYTEYKNNADSKLKEITKYDDKISDLKDEIRKLKNHCESIESTYYGTLILFGGIGCIGCILGIYLMCNIISNTNPIVKQIESMGSPVLTIT